MKKSSFNYQRIKLNGNFTKLDKEKILLLSNYNLGIEKFEGIKEGIENTNYL